MLRFNDTNGPRASGIGTRKRQAIDQTRYRQGEQACERRPRARDDQRLDQRKHHQIPPRQPDQAQERQITLLAFDIGIEPNTKRDEIPNPAQPRE